MTTPVLYDPKAVTEVKDWGLDPDHDRRPLSHTSGVLLAQGAERRERERHLDLHAGLLALSR